VIGATEGETILAINSKKAPFDQLKVRQAISMRSTARRHRRRSGLADRLAYVLSARFPSRPHRPISPILPGEELLKEAGFGAASRRHEAAPFPRRRPDHRVELRDVGIDLEIIPVEWADWLDQVFTKKDYDLTIVSHTEPADIDIYSRKDYYFNYDNPAFDKVIADLNLTSDEAKRTELLKQAQKILADDAVVGFLFELPKVGVWDAKLEGLWDNAPIQANDLTKVKWAE
jgi:peptide/nickel transport system substrate-binding protein